MMLMEIDCDMYTYRYHPRHHACMEKEAMLREYDE